MDALLYFERRAEDEEEAGGDLRWYVTEDGEFFHARRDGDFRLARRFSPAQVERLRDAVADIGFASLPPAEPPDEGVIQERWTAGGQRTSSTTPTRSPPRSATSANSSTTA